VRQGPRLEHDVSFQTFLARRRLSKKTRIFARLMVQGFDAADPRLVKRTLDRRRMGRRRIARRVAAAPARRLRRLFDWLANTIAERGARLQLGSIVRELAWKRGSVQVRGTSSASRSPRAPRAPS